MALSRVVGQDPVVRALTRALERDEMAHSYLFEGLPGIGKTTAGLAFGRALLCESPGTDPCERCRSCALTAAGTHPDLRLYRPVLSASPPGKPHLWITAPSHQPMSLLPIDRIRQLRDETALRPAFGKRKVILLEEADRMTEDSQNCALKTLEEPPGSTTLILTAANGRAFLPTILSRCQRLPFRRVPSATIQSWLDGQDDLSAETELLSRLAEGRPGLARRLGTDDGLRQTRRDLADLVRALLGAEPIDAMRLGERVEALAGDLWPAEPEIPAYSELRGPNQTRAARGQTCEVVAWLSSWLRDLLLLSVGAPPARVTNADDCGWLEPAARDRGAAWFREALSALGAAHWQLLHNANLKLSLDALFTTLLRGRLN